MRRCRTLFGFGLVVLTLTAATAVGQQFSTNYQFLQYPQSSPYASRPADLLASGYVSAADYESANSPGAIPPSPSGAAQNSGGGTGCGQNSCSSEPCCAAPCCCDDMFEHRTGFFGEFLYLRAFGVDVSHGIQQNGVGGLGTVPAGDVGVATPEFEPAYRVGFRWVPNPCNPCSDLSVTYTNYTSSTTNSLSAAPGIGGTTASLLLDPGTVTSASTFSQLNASYRIDFQLADVAYNVLLRSCDNYAVNFGIGIRYAHMQQDFAQVGLFDGAVGAEDTSTGIRFDGAGLRAGLDGQWRIGDSRFAIYGNANISVIFGEFSSHYTQFNTTTDTIEAQSNWSDDRCVPILDYEVGLKWTSCNDHWMASAGYYTAFWFNEVTTGQFVQAVQGADFTNVSKTMDFTGFTSRLEYRF